MKTVYVDLCKSEGFKGVALSWLWMLMLPFIFGVSNTILKAFHVLMSAGWRFHGYVWHDGRDNGKYGESSCQLKYSLSKPVSEPPSVWPRVCFHNPLSGKNDRHTELSDLLLLHSDLLLFYGLRGSWNLSADQWDENRPWRGKNNQQLLKPLQLLHYSPQPPRTSWTGPCGRHALLVQAGARPSGLINARDCQ